MKLKVKLKLKGSVLTIDNRSRAVIGAIAVGQVRDVAGAAHRQSLGNPRPRHRRLPAQARGQGGLLRVAFGTRGQLGFGPAGGVQLVLDEPFGQVFIGFVALSRLAGATESFGEALGEIRRASNAHL